MTSSNLSYQQWLVKYVFCCFYSQETEYEELINNEGVISFVYDKETKSIEPIDVADALDHIGVDDDNQVCEQIGTWEATEGERERESSSVRHGFCKIGVWPITFSTKVLL